MTTSEVDVEQQTDKLRETDQSENTIHFKEKLRKTSRIKVSNILKFPLTVSLSELKLPTSDFSSFFLFIAEGVQVIRMGP